MSKDDGLRSTPLVDYIDALFVSSNDVPVQRAWLNDDSWAIIKECLAEGLPLDYHVVEAEAVYRRKKAAYGDAVRAVSPLRALRDLTKDAAALAEEPGIGRLSYTAGTYPGTTCEGMRNIPPECIVQSESAPILPPTPDEIAAYRDLFRSELDKNMHNSSASPSTDAHHVALHAFVASRNKAAK